MPADTPPHQRRIVNDQPLCGAHPVFNRRTIWLTRLSLGGGQHGLADIRVNHSPCAANAAGCRARDGACATRDVQDGLTFVHIEQVKQTASPWLEHLVFHLAGIGVWNRLIDECCVATLSLIHYRGSVFAGSVYVVRLDLPG